MSKCKSCMMFSSCYYLDESSLHEPCDYCLEPFDPISKRCKECLDHEVCHFKGEEDEKEMEKKVIDEELLKKEIKLKLIERELLNGNDCSEAVFKIKEIGILKTLLSNPDFKIIPKAVNDRSAFLGYYYNQYSYDDRLTTGTRWFALLDALSRGFDITPLTVADYTSYQMDQIIHGIENNLDTSYYADPRFTAEQMGVIRFGLMNGIDVTKYNDPTLSGSIMSVICSGLEDGVDVSPYIKYGEHILMFLIGQLKNGLPDVFDYIDKGFVALQLKEISKGLVDGVDVSIYADRRFNPNQMDEIREGLKIGVNAKIYANPKYFDIEMRLIRKCLSHGYDIEKYITYEMDFDQINQIYLGLEEGLDVSVYANVNYSKKKMEAFRTLLSLGENPEHYIWLAEKSLISKVNKIKVEKGIK